MGNPIVAVGVAMVLVFAVALLVGASALGAIPSEIVQTVTGGPVITSTEFTLTETLQGPQDQALNPQFPVPPPNTAWDLVNASVSIISPAGIASGDQAYIYSEIQRTLPNIWEPNLDNIAYVYASGVVGHTSVIGYGGYGVTGPGNGETWVQYDQVIHDTSVLGFAYAAQLVSRETATFSMTLQPETGSVPDMALYQWGSPVQPLGSQTKTQIIPNSNPPAGYEYRIDNAVAAIAFGSAQGPTRSAEIVEEPSGFVLCSINKYPVNEPLSVLSQTSATGGYSTSQTGVDSGPGQDGTQTVWSSQVILQNGSWLQAEYVGVAGDSGDYAVADTEYTVNSGPPGPGPPPTVTTSATLPSGLTLEILAGALIIVGAMGAVLLPGITRVAAIPLFGLAIYFLAVLPGAWVI